MKTTVLLVDDHPIFRKGLHHLFESEKDIRVVGEAGDGRKAIELVRELLPEVVIMDIAMVGLNGVSTTRRIRSDFENIKVIALSMHGGKQFVANMLEAGASGYILKESAPEELVKGIRAVMSGKIYLSAAITRTVVSEYLKFIPEDYTKAKPLPGNGDDATPVGIMRTKLHPPAMPPDHLHRTRLLQRLDNTRNRLLTLVSAPAGYGKSTLVGSWLATCEIPCAWVSLDEGENDLRCFLNYFLAAINTIFPDACRHTLMMVNAFNQPPLSVLITSLANELNEIETDFILVLDDIHLIRDSAVNTLLSELLRFAPRSLHLILIGRRDPNLPISSLRGKGSVEEIRIRDMKFTVAETAAYLQQKLGREIDMAVAASWAGKIEGWVSGLHLAALSMQHKNGDRLENELLSNIQYVTEYLFNEVLTQQPSRIRRCLLRTAILDRFCASLCETLCKAEDDADEDGNDGWRFIRHLKKENLFIVQLDRKNRWFRYHHLFQQLLRNQFKRIYGFEDRVALHTRASQWYAENELPDEAIAHALQADDMTGAARIVERYRHVMHDKDSLYVMKKWLYFFPWPFIRERPALLSAYAWVRYIHFDIPGIQKVIHAVESLGRDRPVHRVLSGEIDFFRGCIEYLNNNGGCSLAHLETALEKVPVESSAIRGEIEMQHGLASQMLGRKQAAVATLNDLVKRDPAVQGVRETRILLTLVYIHVIAGDLNTAMATNQELYPVAEANGYTNSRVWSMYLKGLTHFFRNDLEKAVGHFRNVIAHKHVLHSRAVADSLAGLALAYQTREQSDRADETLEQLAEFVANRKDPACAMILKSSQARVAILKNDLKPAIDWLQERPPPAENMLWWLEIPAVTYCRTLAAEGSGESLKKAEKRLLELFKAQSGQSQHLPQHPGAAAAGPGIFEAGKYR